MGTALWRLLKLLSAESGVAHPDPEDLTLSASLKTFSSHSAANRHRTTLGHRFHPAEDFARLLPVSSFHSLLAFYTKLLAGRCLIHIGREGRVCDFGLVVL